MVILSAVIYIFNKSIINLIVIIGAVYIAFTFTLSIINSSYKARQSSGLLISTLPDDVLRLSKEKNIIYIVLDAFDASFFETILKDNNSKEYIDIFKDFTFFNNYASVFTNTLFSGAASIAGRPYDNSKPWEQFRKEAFTSGNSLFEILQKEGWNNVLYHEHRNTDAVYAPNYELYSNSTRGIYNKAPKGTERKYLYASVYRITPDFLKNKMKILNATTGNNIWDFRFLNMVENNSFKINNKNTFFLVHLVGAHTPWHIGIDFKKNDNKENYIHLLQPKAALKLVGLYLEKLKAIDTKLYDNSLIVISSDHGKTGKSRINSLLLIKEINGHHNKIQINSKPLYQLYLKDILYDLSHGKSINELTPYLNRKIQEQNFPAIMKNGFTTPLFVYQIPDKLNHQDETYESYKLLSILTHTKDRINGDINLSFPNDYDKLQESIINSGKNTQLGLEQSIGVNKLVFLFNDNKTTTRDIIIKFSNETDCIPRLFISSFDELKGAVRKYVDGGEDKIIKVTSPTYEILSIDQVANKNCKQIIKNIEIKKHK